MKKVTILRGLPRSGKTTLANKLKNEEGGTILSRDCFRLAIYGQRFLQQAENFVWGSVMDAFKALILAGNEHIIVDDTNMSHREIENYANPAAELNYEVIIMSMQTDAATCTKRAKACGQDDLTPVIARMAQKYFKEDMFVYDGIFTVSYWMEGG